MIYFVRAGKFVKIGYTANPKLRMNEIQVGCPHELQPLGFCEGARKEEGRFHDLALPYHYRAEWFRYEGELRRWLNGEDNVLSMMHSDGSVDYCFRSEVGNERALEAWCQTSGYPYTKPTLRQGPKLQPWHNGVRAMFTTDRRS